MKFSLEYNNIGIDKLTWKTILSILLKMERIILQSQFFFIKHIIRDIIHTVR
jgi:hypothetical protein